MVAVTNTFRDVLDGKLDTEEADAALRGFCGDVPFSNGFYNGQAGYRRIAMASPN